MFIVLTSVLVNAVNPVVEGSRYRYLFDEVKITGTTNITNFHLYYNEIEYRSFSADNNENTALNVEIPAHNIKADSQGMLRDFLSLIRADKHPEIKVSFSDNPILSEKDLKCQDQQINITMNGITKTYNCNSELVDCELEKYSIKGGLTVCLTDFEIEPPNKFFGLIKVKNEVFISFKVLFAKDNKKLKIEV